MSRQDPGAATGQGMYPCPPPPDCECNHSYAVHDIGRRAGQQVRTRCDTGTADGRCGCALYRPGESS